MIEGAAEVIRTLRERGDRVIFLSNKPIATRQSYVVKLSKMGIPTTLEDVLNSGMISVLVLTGVATREMAEQSPNCPRHIISSIKEIVNLDPSEV